MVSKVVCRFSRVFTYYLVMYRLIYVRSIGTDVVS